MPVIEGVLYDFAKMLRQGRKDLLELLDAIQYSHNPPEIGHLARMTGLDVSYVRRVVENLRNTGVRARVDYSLQKLGLSYVALESTGSNLKYIHVEHALKSELRTALGALRIYASPQGAEEQLARYLIENYEGSRLNLLLANEVLLSKPSFTYYFEEPKDINPATALELLDNHPKIPIIEEKLYRLFHKPQPTGKPAFRDLIDLMILAGLEIDSLSVQKSLVYIMKKLHDLSFPMRKYSKHKKHITSVIDGFKIMMYERMDVPAMLLYLNVQDNACMRSIAMSMSHYLYSTQIVMYSDINKYTEIEEHMRKIGSKYNKNIITYNMLIILSSSPVYLYSIVDKLKEFCSISDINISFFIAELGAKNYTLTYKMYSPLHAKWNIKLND
ncbi:hypothetical protein APE_1777 [Aeropyrum pernix K1]|uniref:Uncharacterized protein n=1 Tax=Aeropyrum pernix (strain ATCC 700893 / DSM 11879 / JCM 9820 / NBRC 100138 / K1) TaxID=272557 RepID=Q9YB18_AERPE|nr:hypothetical protein [Aeropyrum pernix]BAA80780.1 hypothetical protein APE_1777 [Aeropyrum pernix K1]